MRVDGQIITMEEGKDNVHEFVEKQLEAYKKFCDKYQIPYPKYITVDDSVQSAKMLKGIFPDILVRQDIKHVVNRLVEQMSKKK